MAAKEKKKKVITITYKNGELEVEELASPDFPGKGPKINVDKKKCKVKIEYNNKKTTIYPEMWNHGVGFDSLTFEIVSE